MNKIKAFWTNMNPVTKIGVCFMIVTGGVLLAFNILPQLFRF